MVLVCFLMAVAPVFRVSLLVVTGGWTLMLLQLLVLAQALEASVESAIHKLSQSLVCSVLYLYNVQDRTWLYHDYTVIPLLYGYHSQSSHKKAS